MSFKRSAALSVAAMMSAGLMQSASAELYVYEGFQYSNDGDILDGEPDGSGTPADINATGLGGVWDDQLTKTEHLDIYENSLSFGDLVTNGNHVGSETTSQENIYVRSMTNTNIGSTDDLYFSILIKPTNSNSASRSGLILSDTNATGTNGRFDNVSVTNGIGVGSEGFANFNPFVWDGGVQTASTGSLSTSDGTTYLLVGHLSFNSHVSGDDEFTLYNYNLTTSGGTVTADFANLDIIGETLRVDIDEDLTEKLDVINLTRQRQPFYDEIRVASTLEEALAVPEPTSLALLGLGGLLVASRRRRA